MPKIPEIALAMRLYFSAEEEGRHSRPAIRVALAGMVVGVAIIFKDIVPYFLGHDKGVIYIFHVFDCN